MESFSHMYERPAGPIVRTVYADRDRVMVQFEGEAPYILNICWTAADAVKRVQEIRDRIIASDYDFARAENFRRS